MTQDSVLSTQYLSNTYHSSLITHHFLMTDIAIKVEGLSKQYRIGERESYKALRDVITDAASAPFRRLRSAFRNGNGNGASPASDSSLITQDSVLSGTASAPSPAKACVVSSAV